MKKTERFIVYGVLIGLIVLAAIFDYQITTALYAPRNVLGIVGEVGAEIPCFLLAIFGVSMISRFHPRVEKRGWDVFLTLFFLAAAIGLSAYSGKHLRDLINRCALNASMVPSLVGWIVFGALYFGIGYGCTFLVKKEKTREAFLFAVFVVGLFALSVLLMQAIKMIWLRPRYRTLVAMYKADIIKTDIKNYWLPFYHPQFFTSFKNYQVGATFDGGVINQAQINSVLNSLGVAKWGKEEFYSFLSGHTLNSVICLLLSFLPHLFGKLEEKKNFPLIMRCCIYGYAAIIAVSRILRGAHNATDVLFGYLLGVTLFDIFSTAVYQNILRKRFLGHGEKVS